MDFLGKIFVSGDKEINDMDFKKVQFIGLYFSASWCMPCRYFTSIMMDFYKKINQKTKNMEIVFVTRDHTDSQFADYYKKMPWIAIPFWDKYRINRICLGFAVSRIPTLLIFDNNGNLLTRDGVSDIEEYGLNAFNSWITLREKKKK